MSMDKGLKPRNALARHRNVLTRAERVEALKDVEAWEEDTPVFGLPKVAHRKAVTKKEKPVEEAATAAEGAEVAAEGAAEGVAEVAKGEKAPKAEKAAKGAKAEREGKGKSKGK